MTTAYLFKAVFTQVGVGTAPSPAPVITVVDTANNILVNAQACTALTNIPGVYVYSYSGADSLDLVALFHTTDAATDQKDIYSHTPTQVHAITNTVAKQVDVNVVDWKGSAAAAMTGDAYASLATILADYARRTGDYATVAALSTLQGNVTTILADYARRTGDYATVTALSTLQGNVTTILTDYARRTGDYSTLAAGAKMDLIDTLLNKAGTSGYDRTTDSLEALGEGGVGLTAQDVWDAATVNLDTAGSIGLLLTTDIDAAISSVGGGPAPALGADGKVLISTDAQDLSATLSVDAKTLNGATPNNLAEGAKMDLQDAPNATAITAIQSGLSKPATAQTITANQAVNVAQWGGQNIATPAINGEPVVTLASTQAAYAPSKAGDKMDVIDAPNATGLAAIAKAIWDALTSGLSAVNSIGKLLVTDIDAKISTAGGGLDAAGVRAAIGLATANLDTQLSEIEGETDDIAAIKTQTDQFVFTTPNKVDATATATVDAADIRSAVGLASANLDTQLGAVSKPGTAQKVDDSTPIASDVKKINGHAVQGDGSGTPWGPA